MNCVKYSLKAFHSKRLHNNVLMLSIISSEGSRALLNYRLFVVLHLLLLQKFSNNDDMIPKSIFMHCMAIGNEIKYLTIKCQIYIYFSRPHISLLLKKIRRFNIMTLNKHQKYQKQKPESKIRIKNHNQKTVICLIDKSFTFEYR
jgi:hypothetical protein